MNEDSLGLSQSIQQRGPCNPQARPVAPIIEGPGEVLGAVLANDLGQGVRGIVAANLLEGGMLRRS